MEFTAFNRDPMRQNAWNPLRSIKIHCTTLHGIHCIQSGSIKPRCMEYTGFNGDAFYHAASNPLHSVMPHGTTAFIGILWASLHKIPCIYLGSISPCCMESTAFNDTAWNPLHQSGCILPCCMESTAFSDAAWNALHSIGMLWAMLHKIHCI